MDTAGYQMSPLDPTPNHIHSYGQNDTKQGTQYPIILASSDISTQYQYYSVA